MIGRKKTLRLKWFQVIALAFFVLLLLPLSPVVPVKIYGSEEHKTLVSLTFDDGYGSWVSEAAPLVEKYGLSATAFVNDPIYFGTERNFSRDDIKKLKKIGWEIGWHTAKHLNLKNLNRSQLVDALSGWEKMFEDLELPKPVTFAYPYGSYDSEITELVSKNFLAARTCDPGVNTPEWVKSHPAQLKITRMSVKPAVAWYEGRGVFLVFPYHTVGEAADWQEKPDMTTEEFREICEFLSHEESLGRIEIVTFKEGVRLMKERSSASSWGVKLNLDFGFEGVPKFGILLPNRYLVLYYYLKDNYPSVASAISTYYGLAAFLGILVFILASIGFTLRNILSKDK